MTSSRRAEAIVIGGGIAALATARALSRRGARILLSAPELPGGATSAAGGILAPTIEAAEGAVFEFGRASRDFYPEFADVLQSETGIDVELRFDGVLRLALTSEEATRLSKSVGPNARWMDDRAVAELEPALAPCAGALIHEADGIVANEKVHAALRAAVRASPLVHWSGQRVIRVDAAQGSAVLANGESWSAQSLVLAAGAWAAGLPGLPRQLPIVPTRGQMITIRGVGLRRAVYGGGGYMVPRRDGRILVGSTLEQVGFDHATTASAVEHFVRIATTLLARDEPPEVVEQWAGLRPMTPDGFPIIGHEPLAPRLVYACGHSKNGILMGPLTGEVVADLVLGTSPAHNLAPFQPARFVGSE